MSTFKATRPKHPMILSSFVPTFDAADQHEIDQTLCSHFNSDKKFVEKTFFKSS
jgi:hypothetical protein